MRGFATSVGRSLSHRGIPLAMVRNLRCFPHQAVVSVALHTRWRGRIGPDAERHHASGRRIAAKKKRSLLTDYLQRGWGFRRRCISSRLGSTVALALLRDLRLLLRREFLFDLHGDGFDVYLAVLCSFFELLQLGAKRPEIGS